MVRYFIIIPLLLWAFLIFVYKYLVLIEIIYIFAIKYRPIVVNGAGYGPFSECRVAV